MIQHMVIKAKWHWKWQVLDDWVSHVGSAQDIPCVMNHEDISFRCAFAAQELQALVAQEPENKKGYSVYISG